MKCFAGCKHAPPFIDLWAYSLGEPAGISETFLTTNSFELEREAREPRARSASSVVEARAKREKRAQRVARFARSALRAQRKPSALLAQRCWTEREARGNTNLK